MPIFGKPLGKIVQDNTKVPVATVVDSDSYLLMVNTASGSTKKMLASEFMKGWDETVPTFSALPDFATHTGKLYLVTTSTGIWPTKKHAGLYTSNGASWSRLGVLQGLLTENTPLSSLSESATLTNLVTTDTPLTALGKVKKYFTEYLTSFNGANQLVKLDATGNMPSSSTLDTITAGTAHKHFTVTEKTKLSGIEIGATADQTNAEIKAAYEANNDTNAFTDDDQTKLSGIDTGAEANAVDSVAGKTGVVTLVKADVGLANVDNTSDASKPISTDTQTALDGKVDDSQVLTNVPLGAVFTDNNAVDSVAGKTGVVTLVKADVGLANVENKSSSTIRGEITDANIPSTITRDTELTAHTNKTDNPHSVTAVQLGITDEFIQDIVGAMVAGNSESGITVTYDDATGKINIAVPSDMNTYINAASFNTNTGVLTFTLNDTTTVTVDLDGKYENEFSKNTAFNKNFGIGLGEVCQGNDSRLSNSRKWNATINTGDKPTARTNLEVYSKGEVDTKAEVNTKITNAKSNWNEADSNSDTYIQNKPTVPASFAPTDAEANVKSNWNEADSNSDTYIQNKPTVPASFAPTNAEANVKSNWNEADSNSDTYIQNKPTVPASFAPTNAEANVKSNWNEANTNSDAYIQNKPTIPSQVTVENSVSSTSTTDALSANQGKLMADKLALYQRMRLSAYNMSGGGNITWDNNNLSTSSRLIWIPSGNGSGDHWNLNLSNLNVPAWNVAYIRLTEDETKAYWNKNKANVSVTPYGSYVPNDRDLIIGHHNGDNGNFIFASGLSTGLAAKYHTHPFLDMEGKLLSSQQSDYFRMDWDSGWKDVQKNYYYYWWHGLNTQDFLIFTYFKTPDGRIFTSLTNNVSSTADSGYHIQPYDTNQIYVFTGAQYVYSVHYSKKVDGNYEWSEANNRWTTGQLRVVLKRFTT